LSFLYSVKARHDENLELAPARGRRNSLTNEDEQALRNALTQRVLKERSMNRKDVTKATQGFATKRRQERGQALFGWQLSRTTVTKYVGRNSRVREHPQTKTERRLYSESDARNFASLVAVLRAIFGVDVSSNSSTFIHDYNVFNTDVTTAVLSSGGAEFEPVYVTPDIDRKMRAADMSITRAARKSSTDICLD
jgi:hypothetical protein